MKKSGINYLVTAGLALILMIGAACSRQEPDVNAIAETVLTRLTPQASANQSDTDQIVQSVVATLEADGAGSAEQDVTTLVQQAVEAQLQAQAGTVQINGALPVGGLSMEQTLVQLYQTANPATVFIVVPGLGSGSGFVFDSAGHIVTNNHVVSGGERFEMVFASGERQFAQLVGTDVDSDLAVLRVDSLPAGVNPLPLANPESIQVGQFVISLGNPFGEQGSMGLGIISGQDRSLLSQRALGGARFSLPEVYQTDAAINPGNSGGPLLNLAGEVIGVNSAIRTTTGANSGVGFSIPVAAVARIIPNLIEFGEHRYSYLGIGLDDELTLDEAELFGLEQTVGAYVLSVENGGPAQAAGIIPANPSTGRGGDLIVALDGTPVTNFADLNSYLVFNTSAGDEVQITVLRDGEEMVLPAILGRRP